MLQVSIERVPDAEHRVAGVKREIEDDLFELGGIRFHMRGFWIEAQDYVHVFADYGPQQPLALPYQNIQIQNSGPQYLAMAEGEEPRS